MITSLKRLIGSGLLLAFIVPLFNISNASAQENDQSLKDIFSEFSLKSLLDVRIVTVSKKEETVFEAPLSSTVLTEAEIKKAGATSIMEALRLIPGVIVREQTPGNYDIHIRGLDGLDPYSLGIQKLNTTTLVMINNRIVYNDVFGGTLWDVLSIGIDDVQKIEVVRGPAAALYGPNAATGVINIITKSPNEQAGWTASSYAQYGNHTTALANASVSYATDDKKYAFRLSTNVDKRDRHQVDYFLLPDPEGAFSGDPGFFKGGYIPDPTIISNGSNNPIAEKQFPDWTLATERLGLNSHLSYNTKDIELDFMGGYASSSHQRVYFMNHFFTLSTEENESGYGYLNGRWNNFSFSTDYSDTRNHTLQAFDFSFRTFNTSLEYNFPINEFFSIKPGVAFHWTEFESRDSSLIFTDQSYTSTQIDELDAINGQGSKESNYFTSLFIRGDYYYKRARFIGALRLEKYNLPDKYLFSPQIISTLQPTDDFILRASYGRSSRSPYAADLFTHFKANGVSLLAYLVSPEEESEDLLTIDVYEIGLRYKLTKDLSVDLELFYMYAENFDDITTGGLPPKAFFAYEISTLTAKNYGATLSLTYVPNPKLRLNGFVTVQETNVDDYNFNPDVVYGFVEDLDAPIKDSSFTNKNTPTFFGGVNISYTPVSKLMINLNGYFYTEQTRTLAGIAPATEKVQGNLLLNTVVRYSLFDNLSIFMNARNLVGANKRQYGMTDRIKFSILGGIDYKL